MSVSKLRLHMSTKQSKWGNAVFKLYQIGDCWLQEIYYNLATTWHVNEERKQVITVWSMLPTSMRVRKFPTYKIDFFKKTVWWSDRKAKKLKFIWNIFYIYWNKYLHVFWNLKKTGSHQRICQRFNIMYIKKCSRWAKQNNAGWTKDPEGVIGR